MNEVLQPMDRMAALIEMAAAAGADAADAVSTNSRSLTVICRLGQQEEVQGAEQAKVGLRVFVGKRQAIVSSTDFSKTALADLAERAVSMARAVPEDPYCGLADPDLLAGDTADVDGCDESEPTVERLFERALAAEDAARAVPGVTNSEGAEASWSRSRSIIVASNGFARTMSRSNYSLSASVLAGSGTEMERDYEYSSTVFGEDLDDPVEIGRSAGERAVKRLHPRKAQSAQAPVIYDSRSARSLLGHLSMAINGASVARGTSFLGDKKGERIFPQGVAVIDDPYRRRGLRSKPFDGEGLATRRLALIDDGVLTSWILDLRSARQLALAPTGHAARGTASPPSPAPSNLYLEPGADTPESLIGAVERGLLVTELIGFGVNGVTGDYSRGASGFWIENGEISYPVSEVTVAGNLLEMFAKLTPANDLRFRYGADSPTVRIDGMTVAGV